MDAAVPGRALGGADVDRKSTRLNSSHLGISYAVFCLKTKKNTSELQSIRQLVCRILLEKIKAYLTTTTHRESTTPRLIVWNIIYRSTMGKYIRQYITM